MREQSEHGVPDQAHGRLVARDDQERDHARQLLLGQRVAAVLDRDERADEVLAGLLPPLVEESEQVVDEGGQQGVGPVRLVGRQRRPDHRGRPLPEPVAVGNGRVKINVCRSLMPLIEKNPETV